MKTIQFSILAILVNFITVSCSSSDPVVIHEEELITTVQVTLTPTQGGDVIVLKSKDLDGDGPNVPVLTDTGNLRANTVYNATVLLLNETETPAEDITVEVKEEGDVHQFFYQSGDLNFTTTYVDSDVNQKPIGVEFTLQTGNVGSGNFTIILRHEPEKNAAGVSEGVITNAGGETDIEVSFPLDVIAN